MGFHLTERMSGFHEFRADGFPAGRLPFSFRVTWGPESIRRWLDPRSDSFLWQELVGEVHAAGLCEAAPCRGTLELAYHRGRRIRYAFDFDVAGTTDRYVGAKENIHLHNLMFSHTTLFGTVSEVASGRLISSSVAYFSLRDLPGFLLGSRLGSGAPVA